MKPVTINHESRLYVIPAGDGYTTLGFDYAEKRRVAVLEWVGMKPVKTPLGTAEHYAAYVSAMRIGADFAAQTGKKCPAELTPELVGLEGKRVEIQLPDGERHRFKVGKSTGWMPCHLELANARSTGGGAVYFPAGSRVVRIIEPRRTR